ncbi:YidB family protein [Streptomyces sp. NPDC056883]|uniref:YidB family protein n=1 Tax=Streptomyces sp. NPDC056883 TaxID=3345959 RepID=UPI003675222E
MALDAKSMAATYPIPTYRFVVAVGKDTMGVSSAPGLETPLVAINVRPDGTPVPQLPSWVGSGNNEPITAQEVTDIIGEVALAQTAAATGRHPAEVAKDIATHLPNLVDKATPDGHVVPNGAKREVNGIVLEVTAD